MAIKFPSALEVLKKEADDTAVPAMDKPAMPKKEAMPNKQAAPFPVTAQSLGSVDQVAQNTSDMWMAQGWHLKGKQ